MRGAASSSRPFFRDANDDAHDDALWREPFVRALAGLAGEGANGPAENSQAKKRSQGTNPPLSFPSSPTFAITLSGMRLEGWRAGLVTLRGGSTPETPLPSPPSVRLFGPPPPAGALALFIFGGCAAPSAPAAAAAISPFAPPPPPRAAPPAALRLPRGRSLFLLGVPRLLLLLLLSRFELPDLSPPPPPGGAGGRGGPGAGEEGETAG